MAQVAEVAVVVSKFVKRYNRRRNVRSVCVCGGGGAAWEAEQLSMTDYRGHFENASQAGQNFVEGGLERR